MSIIHGILITKTSPTIPWKGDLFSYIQPNGKNMRFRNVSKPEGVWSTLYDPNTQTDLIGAMAAPNSSYTISSNKSFDIGNSFYHSLYFDTVNSARVSGDVAICQCVVHGAWEMGADCFQTTIPSEQEKPVEKLSGVLVFPRGSL